MPEGIRRDRRKHVAREFEWWRDQDGGAHHASQATSYGVEITLRCEDAFGGYNAFFTPAQVDSLIALAEGAGPHHLIMDGYSAYVQFSATPVFEPLWGLTEDAVVDSCEYYTGELPLVTVEYP